MQMYLDDKNRQLTRQIYSGRASFGNIIGRKQKNKIKNRQNSIRAVAVVSVFGGQ
jgi:hypothetical protein